MEVQCDLEKLTHLNIVVGRKQVVRVLEKQDAVQVFVALDADPVMIQPVLHLCKEQDIPIVEVKTMRELGRACGISVGSATVAQF